MKATQVRMTEGSIPDKIIRFAVPLFLGNLFQQLYNTADALIVGNLLGDRSLAAVTSTGTLVFLLVGFFTGIFMGAGVVISRYFGSRETEKMRKAVHNAILFALISGGALTLIGTTLTPIILGWMGTPAEVMPQSVTYIRIYFAGSLGLSLYNSCMGIMQAVGDSRHPLYYLIISSVTNVCLDLLFIGVFRMGVDGAALATILAQFLSAALCLVRMSRDTGEMTRLQWRLLRWDKYMMGRIFRQGLPTGVQNAVISLGNVVIQSNINSFGSYAMSGLGAYSKIEGFAFLSVTAMSMTLPTFVSQNLGAGNISRAKKGAVFGCLTGMAAAELTGIVMFVFIPQLLTLFIDTPEAIAYGTLHARIDTLFYCMLALAHCSAGVLRGCGKPTVPMVIMLGCWCVLRSVYVTLILKVIHQFRMICWAYPLTWTVSCVFFVFYLSRLDWNKSAEAI